MDSEEVLSVLFSYVGVGHFLYVAGVSRSWRTNYTTKAENEDRDLMTKWQDALVTIASLEYAFASGLQFTSGFHPEKDEFGPGVYEWARQHGYPFFVWAAAEVFFLKSIDTLGGSVVGVFSCASKAKEAALARRDLTEEGVNWEESNRNSFELYPRTHYADTYCSVTCFAVDGLVYADENDLLPLYVTSSTFDFSSPGFKVEGVFPTKKSANESMRKAANLYGSVVHGSNGFMAYSLIGVLERSITWEGYLDGEGGAAGNFFK